MKNLGADRTEVPVVVPGSAINGFAYSTNNWVYERLRGDPKFGRRRPYFYWSNAKFHCAYFYAAQQFIMDGCRFVMMGAGCLAM